MSRTTRSIPHWANPRKNEYENDLTKYGQKLADEMREHSIRLSSGRDGVIHTTMCGTDSSHPTGFNSWDDVACGINSKRYFKRAASHARRNYHKRIVDADLKQVYAGDFEPEPDVIDYAEIERMEEIYAEIELKEFREFYKGTSIKAEEDIDDLCDDDFESKWEHMNDNEFYDYEYYDFLGLVING